LHSYKTNVINFWKCFLSSFYRQTTITEEAQRLKTDLENLETEKTTCASRVRELRQQLSTLSEEDKTE